MRWLWTLIFIAFGYFISLIVFRRGLLLKRYVTAAKSNCADVVRYDVDSCWLPARFKRAIVLIVDALRYDYIKPNFDGKYSSYSWGHMPLTAALLTKQGNDSSAKLFHFVSPTTTFQRIKAVISGNIPTFMEADENFGAIQITEDNIIDQIVNMGKIVIFLGTDTWSQILPNRFYRHFVLSSFDIEDLHSVDNMVIDQIYDEVQRRDWHLLMAHVPGIDFCDRRYGFFHSAMRRKLHQMDELIHNLTRAIDNDTVLFVIGNQGMTNTGDRGGDSQQSQAALLAYAKTGFSVLNFSNVDAENDEVDQIDVVPTLSLLLGVPIPFSNIGRVIESLIHPTQLNMSLKLNAVQVLRYAQEYSNLDAAAQPLFLPIMRRSENAPSDADAGLNREIIDDVKRVMRAAFQANDTPLALVGFLSIIESMLFHVHIVFGLLGDVPKLGASWAQLIFRSALILLQLSLYFDAELESHSRWRTDLLTFSALTLSASFFYTLAVLCLRLFFKRVLVFKKHIKDLMLVTVLVTQTFTFASNSFVIHEPAVIRFLLVCFLTILFVGHLRDNRRTKGRSNSQQKRTLSFFHCVFGNSVNRQTCLSFAIVLCLIRCFVFFEICREENTNCNAEGEHILRWLTGTDDIYDEVVQERIRSVRVLIAISLMFIVNYLIIRRGRQSNCAQPGLTYSNGFDVAAFGRSLTWPLCIGVAMHWLCELIETNMIAHGIATVLTAKYARSARICAQAVYIMAITYSIIGFYLLRKPKFGLQYFIVFDILRQMAAIVIAMIIGDWMAIGFYLLYLTLLIVEPLVTEDGALMHTTLFYILGATAFYSLGHQCVFTAIPWNAAFVGLSSNFPMRVIAALLILIHLFAGNIFVILSFPTVVLKSADFTQSSTDSLKTKPLLFVLFNAFRVLGSCVACLFLWNNSMFLNIFAPKLIFEAINLLVCFVVVISLQLVSKNC